MPWNNSRQTEPLTLKSIVFWLIKDNKTKIPGVCVGQFYDDK